MQVQTSKGNGQKPLVKKSDFVEVGLIGVYLTQKLGMPTLQEIQDTAENELRCALDGRTLSRALRGASKRSFIAIEQHPIDDGKGTVKKVYSMKDVGRWKQPPEYAHINDLLPALLRTEEAARIKRFFDGSESPKDAAKKTKGNVIDDYYAFRATVKTLDPLLGSQIHCPFTDQARKRNGVELPSTIVDARGKVDPSKKKSDVPDVEAIFIVDELTGAYVIPPDVLSGWLATNAARYAGLPEARAAYVAFSPVYIKPAQPAVQLVLPVNNARQGASAPKSHEAILAGEVFDICFMAPTKGALSPEQWEKLFILAGLRPRRGLSPARGKRYGRFKVLKWENLGPVKKSDLKFLLDDLPAELRADSEYLEEALARLKDVPLAGRFVGSSGAEGDDEAEFNEDQ